jgi:predicted PurR-regulated permease PerM
MPAKPRKKDTRPAAAKAMPPRPPEPIAMSAKGALRIAIIGIFLIMLVGALYFAQDLIIPISLAFMLSVLLSPIVRAFARIGVPEGVSAVGIVLGLIGIMVVGGWSLSGPFSELINDAPRIAAEAREKVAVFRGWFGFVEQMSQQVDEMAASSDPQVMQVVLKEPGLLKSAATGVPQVVAKTGLALVLLLFSSRLEICSGKSSFAFCRR